MTHSEEIPFKISVPDDQLANLRQKLDLARFPDELSDSGRKYGAQLSDIRRLVDRWRNGFDWQKVEAQLNEDLPQFTRDIEVEGHGSLNIHYVHQRSKVANAIPLLFVHGWPGSFLEVSKILPLLTSDSSEYPSFHVVALSLPGYGFSQAPSKPGFSLASYAEVGHKLMVSLGYDKYVTQGGDWGFFITRKISSVYGGKHVKAWHTNFPVSGPPTLSSYPLIYLKHLLHKPTATEKTKAERAKWFQTQGQGYFAEHSTQPQTIGYSLADSPIGLLGWIYEKLINWTDEYPWTDDEVLTWVSIYWFSRAGPAASVRIYYEVMHAGDRFMRPSERSNIPFGVSLFPKELRHIPQQWLPMVGNLVFKSEYQSGGHFAAHEKPDELVNDLRQMFGRGGKAFGVVPDKTGYA